MFWRFCPLKKPLEVKEKAIIARMNANVAP